jgi:hypothetical protein
MQDVARNARKVEEKGAKSSNNPKEDVARIARKVEEKWARSSDYHRQDIARNARKVEEKNQKKIKYGCVENRKPNPERKPSRVENTFFLNRGIITMTLHHTAEVPNNLFRHSVPHQ